MAVIMTTTWDERKGIFVGKQARTGGKRRWASIRKNAVLYGLLLIPVVYILVFKYYPMYGALIAFQDYSIAKGFAGSPWVGLKHFRMFVQNYMFLRVLRNTVVISLYSLATFPIPVMLAVLIHTMPLKKFTKSVQLITYAPHFISTVVMCGMILQFLALRGGMVNNILNWFGLESVDFLGDAGKFAGVFVFSGVWQSAGYSSIIYISALSGVDGELHEAATVDGASLLRRIWHIDLPSILPTIVVMFVLRCGSILSVGYEKVLLLQNSLNISASEVISTYVYKQGLASAIPQFSYSTAVGLFVSVINMMMLVTVNQISKALTGSSLW